MPRLLLRVAAALVLLLGVAFSAQAEPDYPAFTGLVVDAAHILGDGDRAVLTQKLTDLEKKTGVQFAVATVPSLEGLEIEPYANGLFRKWGVGQKGSNNGLLLILAPNEKKLRFEVGYGLEGTMTDAQSKLILHNDMVPKLKTGDAAGALRAGVDDAIAVLTKDSASLPPNLRPKASDTDASGTIFLIIFGIFFVSIIVMSFRSRGRGWSRGASWGTGGFIGGSAGGDSSSSGDSFSGGGGGDSGGGGSSDSY